MNRYQAIQSTGSVAEKFENKDVESEGYDDFIQNILQRIQCGNGEGSPNGKIHKCEILIDSLAARKTGKPETATKTMSKLE